MASAGKIQTFHGFSHTHTDVQKLCMELWLHFEMVILPPFFSKHFTLVFLHLVLFNGTPELARPLPTPQKWGKPQQPVQTPRQRAALTLSRVISGRLGVMSLLSLSCSEMGSDAS